MSDEFQVVPEKSLPKKKSKSRRSAARPAPVEDEVEVEQPAPPTIDRDLSERMRAFIDSGDDLGPPIVLEIVNGGGNSMGKSDISDLPLLEPSDFIPDADEAAGRAWAAGLTPGQRAWLRGAMEEVRFGE